MALNKCPKCGKEVFPQEKNCPQCGYPLILAEVEPGHKNRMPYILGVVIALATIITILAFTLVR